MRNHWHTFILITQKKKKMQCLVCVLTAIMVNQVGDGICDCRVIAALWAHSILCGAAIIRATGRKSSKSSHCVSHMHERGSTLHPSLLARGFTFDSPRNWWATIFEQQDISVHNWRALLLNHIYWHLALWSLTVDFGESPNYMTFYIVYNPQAPFSPKNNGAVTWR